MLSVQYLDKALEFNLMNFLMNELSNLSRFYFLRVLDVQNSKTLEICLRTVWATTISSILQPSWQSLRA